MIKLVVSDYWAFQLIRKAQRAEEERQVIDGAVGQAIRRDNHKSVTAMIGFFLFWVVVLWILYSAAGLVWWLALVFLGGGFILFLMLYQYLSHHNNDTRHPFFLQLQRFGDPYEAIRRINEQVSSPDVKRFGPVRVTPEWLILPEDIPFLHRNEVMWVYQKVTKHSINFIPVGTTRAVVICYATAKVNRAGEIKIVPVSFETPEMKEANVIGLIRQIAENAPWVPIGYKKELAKLWRSHREDFFAAVQEARQKMTVTS